jgi:hypothetical protein
LLPHFVLQVELVELGQPSVGIEQREIRPKRNLSGTTLTQYRTTNMGVDVKAMERHGSANLHDPVDERGRRVHLIRLEVARLDDVLDLGDRDTRRHRH